MSTTTITTSTLKGVVADHVAAVNAFDTDAVLETFADDALVNDARREFWGGEAIRHWVAEEIVGDRVTIEVTEVIKHHALTIVRARYDGQYDKTGLPEELVLTNYFTVREGRIDSLIVIRNRPAREAGLGDGAPKVVRRYFEHDAHRDIAAILALFTDDATVVDEGHTRHGTAEIEAWQTGPASTYNYTTEVLESEPRTANRYAVTGRLTGNFPGGTADLRWDFTVAGDRISRLVIAP